MERRNSCPHAHRVNESKLRSFLKALNGRILEVLIDAVILYVLGIPFLEGIGVAVLIEGVCFGVCYVVERIWNKISFGRKIVSVDQKT